MKRLGLALVFLCGAVGAGCTTANGPVIGSGPAADEDPFRAVSMRAHPLTRLVRENGVPVRLEAHVEFFDHWGHTVKALGVLRFELRGASGDAGDPSRTAAEPVRWDVIDLENPAASSRAFDPATGTYWVRLRMPGTVRLGGSPTLAVVFTASDDGERMSSVIELE